MAVKSVECQLAELQIGRYVAGEPLSSEALKQLERHVANCTSCNRVLSDRKQALRSMLNTGYAAVRTDFTTDEKENLLIKALREKATGGVRPTRTPEATAEASPPASEESSKKGVRARLLEKSSTNKIAGYCIALVAVLLGMGYFSRNQSEMFGGSAERAFQNKQPAQSSNTAPPKRITTILHSQPAKQEHPKTPKPSTPLAKPVEAKPTAPAIESQPVPEQVSLRRPNRTIHHRRPIVEYAPPKPRAKRASAARITVYDESGNPLRR